MKFIINYNYLVDQYPWRSVIITTFILGLATLESYLGNYYLAGLGLIIFILLLSLRTFYQGNIKQKYYGEWFKRRKSDFFMIKEKNDIYNRLVIYNYKLEPNPIYEKMGFNYEKYTMTNIYYGQQESINCRFASRKEIEKYNLRNLEAKILLSQK